MSTALTCRNKEELSYLPSYPQLEFLVLRHLGLEGSELGVLRHCLKLRSLDLEGNGGLDDEGMRFLSGLTQMQHLNLSRTDVGDEGLLELRWMSSLVSLSLGRTEVTEDGLLTCLPHWPHLQRLELEGVSFSRGGLGRLLGMGQGLLSLDLSETGVEDRDVGHLGRLQQLQELRLFGVELTDSGLSSLMGLQGLRVLGFTDADGINLQRLHQFPNLQELYLKGGGLDEADFSELTGLPLLVLGLLGCRVEDLLWLRQWPMLHTLDLSGSEFSDKELQKVLPSMLNLRNIRLSDTPVTDETLRVIAGLPYLEELDVSYTRVGDRGLGWLERTNSQSLRAVHASFSEISEVGVEDLQLQLGGSVEVDRSEERLSSGGVLGFWPAVIFGLFCGVIGWFGGGLLGGVWAQRFEASPMFLYGFCALGSAVLGGLLARRLF